MHTNKIGSYIESVVHSSFKQGGGGWGNAGTIGATLLLIHVTMHHLVSDRDEDFHRVKNRRSDLSRSVGKGKIYPHKRPCRSSLLFCTRLTAKCPSLYPESPNAPLFAPPPLLSRPSRPITRPVPASRSRTLLLIWTATK